MCVQPKGCTAVRQWQWQFVRIFPPFFFPANLKPESVATPSPAKKKGTFDHASTSEITLRDLWNHYCGISEDKLQV